jgi:peptidoglycan/xylan/chitin deacetylase (PgdA/CDA1 family)
MTPLPSVRVLKRTALHSLERVGCAGLVGRSRWRRQRLLILAYHGISQDDEHRWNGALYMSQEMLEERLGVLNRTGCTVLPLAEGVQRLYAGTLDDRSVAVTFDDAYCDFVTRAFPLLQKYGIPVTMYLPTFAVGWNTPVFQLACSYMLWKTKHTRLHLPEVQPEPFDLSNASARAATVGAIHAAVKRRSGSREDRDTLARHIAERLSVDYDAVVSKRLFQVMPAEDVRRLAAAGVDFQLHTHSHHMPLDRDLFERQIVENRRVIHSLTGVRATHFCYPSGAYDRRFLPWLADLDVKSATTCDPGFASPKTPRLMLPRFVDTSNCSTVEFHGWLTGTAALLSRGRSYGTPAS